MKTAITILPAIFGIAGVFAQGTPIANFGSNPGNINAYEYVPSNMPANAPLVVVIHGCTQDAAEYATSTGWNDLADKHKFYVVHVEQKSANNSNLCFNYWEPGDHSRGQGEARSIKQTVDYMKSNYSIDSSRVFVSGLSAGGAMTIVMLSAYPEIFTAGAEMAGLPYKVATSSIEVYLAAVGGVSKTPQEWGNLVRTENPNFTGRYPRLCIFHGTSDIVINDNNADEAIKQFTNLHGTDQTADYYDGAFLGNSNIKLRQFTKASGDVVVQYFALDGMAHGIAVNPGQCYDEGGSTVGVSFDFGIHSTFYAAMFFGILQAPFAITGSNEVFVHAQNVSYSVPATAGATYDWEVPADATIVSGQGTNSISVNWGAMSGRVGVTETLSNGCVNPVVELPVTVQQVTSNLVFNDAREKLCVRQKGDSFEFMVSGTNEHPFNARVFDLSGKIISEKNGLTANDYHPISVNFPAGIYILSCTTARNILQQKVVID